MKFRCKIDSPFGMKGKELVWDRQMDAYRCRGEDDAVQNPKNYPALFEPVFESLQERLDYFKEPNLIAAKRKEDERLNVKVNLGKWGREYGHIQESKKCRHGIFAYKPGEEHLAKCDVCGVLKSEIEQCPYKISKTQECEHEWVSYSWSAGFLKAKSKESGFYDICRKCLIRKPSLEIKADDPSSEPTLMSPSVIKLQDKFELNTTLLPFGVLLSSESVEEGLIDHPIKIVIKNVKFKGGSIKIETDKNNELTTEAVNLEGELWIEIPKAVNE